MLTLQAAVSKHGRSKHVHFCERLFVTFMVGCTVDERNIIVHPEWID